MHHDTPGLHRPVKSGVPVVNCCTSSLPGSSFVSSRPAPSDDQPRITVRLSNPC